MQPVFCRSNPKAEMRDYDLHAVVATEVELDVLTGEKNVRRVDLLQDVGDSTSPWVNFSTVLISLFNRINFKRFPISSVMFYFP